MPTDAAMMLFRITVSNSYDELKDRHALLMHITQGKQGCSKGKCKFCVDFRERIWHIALARQESNLKMLTAIRAYRQTYRIYQMAKIKILTEKIDRLSPIWHSGAVGRDESPPRNIGTAGRT